SPLNRHNNVKPRIYIFIYFFIIRLANPKLLQVHAGTNFLNIKGDVYDIASFTTHYDYDPTRFINDIALIYLNRPLTYNTLMQPINLQTTDEILDNMTCTLSGWGTTKLGGEAPNDLQEIDLKIYPQQKCEAVNKNVRDSHICTLTKEGEGVCHGDSGGPLVCNGFQVGIVSFGTPCAVGKPDVYTRVSSFAKWISNNL
ncbi:PREDICTED: chymotrypsin-1-like, partial [Vollenhovia emeryi]|uniref:chymotrypsin-1-like n=1 Tax=Vollenhovia emeryi TaxID=411798 RepID=UPI0005F44614